MNAQSGLPAELTGFGNVEGYSHYPKTVTSGPPVPAGGGLLKWYDIAEAATPVTRETCALAQRFLAAETATGRLNLKGELGFVILHRCGGDFHFLLVSSWRNANEMWETVYAKTGDAPDFSLFALPGPHRATFCVWELAAVNHERQAFSRYLFSARDDTAKRVYLGDMYEGGA